MKLILAADIGGTNCRFGVFKVENSAISLEKCVWIPTSQVTHTPSFLKAMEDATGIAPGDTCCMVVAMAGPVFGKTRGHLTNGALELDFTTPDYADSRFWIINDFMAQAWAVMSMEGEHAEKICGADSINPAGTRGIVGAGTGLGYASMVNTATFGIPQTPGQWLVLPSENGHAAFPFVNPAECAFHEFLCKKLHIGHATGDDVLAGRGLAVLHEFLTGEALSAPEVGETALKSETETLIWYSRFYGRVCRNWILALMSTGGLWIAGGIAAQNPLCVHSSHFMNELHDGNPRWKDFLEKIPIYHLADKNSGLWGAAWFGLQMVLEQTRKRNA